MEDQQLNRYYGCLTFVAKQRSHDLCGSNGLPLTPNSIKILGRAQFLKTLDHPNLFSYIDILRGKHERTVIVSEQYGTPLSEFIFENWLEIVFLARDVLKALSYLHSKDVIHRSLSKKNIFFSNNCWKLFNYGLYYMTGNGIDVMFPIGDITYFSPDVILQGPCGKTSGKADIWSLGIILVELLLQCDFSKTESLSLFIKNCLSFIDVNDVFYYLAKKFNKCDILKKLPNELIAFVNKMLQVNPIERLSARELLKEEIFNLIDFENVLLRRRNDHFLPLNRHSLLELYHYWQLAGGDVYHELKKEGLIRTKPAILTIPNLLLLEGTAFGQTVSDARIFDGQLIYLTVDHLIERFKKLPKIYRSPDLRNSFVMSKEFSDMASLPLAIKERDTDYQFKRIQLFKAIFKYLPSERHRLLKESRQDIPPFLRAILFWANILEIGDNYVHEYTCIDKETPMSTDRQIEVDIPRCHQYNELLSSSAGHGKFKRILKAWVKGHPEYVYWQGLDSLCAPFLHLNFNNEELFLVSVEKFQDLQVLKTFYGSTAINYFQKLLLFMFLQIVCFVINIMGTESVEVDMATPCANAVLPTLSSGLSPKPLRLAYMQQRRITRAYMGLKKFIDKFLHNFFLRDNSAVIKEYLAKFKQLIAFLDPHLANHLLMIGFSPELFAIPWFLTMFSHVFPIQKILNLWDSLLLGSASYPLFIGFSILQQLRSVLLESGFNECILLFSDLPEIDIEKCVKDSLLYSQCTPRSVTYRQNEVLDKNDKALFEGLDSPAVTIDTIIKECCPRISSTELKTIIQNPLLKTKMVLLDIRHSSLYNESHVPGSINIHVVDMKLEKHSDYSLLHKSELSVLNNNKGKIITVIGDNDKRTAEFCSFLLKCGFPRVCSLNGGFRALNMNGKPFI